MSVITWEDSNGNTILEYRHDSGSNWTIVHPDDIKLSMYVKSDAAGNIQDAAAHPYVGATVTEMLTGFTTKE